MTQQAVYQLVKKLWSIICNNFTKEEIIEIVSVPYHPIFTAAEVGNFGFLSELVSAYPSLIWEMDEREQQTIIHKAVIYRHANIFNVLHEIGSQKDIITTMVDTSGNTLLHLASKIAPPSRLELASGAAFHMFFESVWFQKIEMAVVCCGHSIISYNKFLSHSASLPAADKATNSASIIECEIHVCFFEVQLIAPPPMVKIQPEVDLLSLRFVIQLASE
ncbi:hypothetical protein PIB30_080298 [Stylosanthes scabra]|uniref:Uncharacterized protein n=1 Tax=Stylosanthes scabra TaxID=79078 RepID=A0ABU6UU17_9FABA|nr:hypothetical protein [Stylosanthes scabra]